MQHTSASHYGKAILLSFIFLLLAIVALSFYNVAVKEAGFTNNDTIHQKNGLIDRNQGWTVGLLPNGHFLASGRTHQTTELAKRAE